MKEEQKLGKVHEVVLKAQVVATSEMATTMCAKVETLQEHMTLQLFKCLWTYWCLIQKQKNICNFNT
jgi:hypothetical protein